MAPPSLISIRNNIRQVTFTSHAESMLKNFKFYADESGHADDPALYYAGMAGFGAPAGAWEVFEGEGNNLLRFAGVSELHMKYFVHSEGEFAKWKGKGMSG